MEEDSLVLVSWVAVNNDPYVRERGQHSSYVQVDGKPVPGPTLCLMFDGDSEYCGRIRRAFFLVQRDARSKETLKDTLKEIRRLAPGIECASREVPLSDPTDYDEILSGLNRRASIVDQLKRPARNTPLTIIPNTVLVPIVKDKAPDPRCSGN